MSVISGKTSFFAVCFLALLLVALTTRLHGSTSMLTSVILYGAFLGFMVSTFLWVGQLLSSSNIKGQSSNTDIKLRMGIKLSLYVLFAFASGFLMIPAYYYLNGDGGHVCGAIDTKGHSQKLAAGEHAQVYLLKSTNGDHLPIRYEFNKPQLKIAQGEADRVELKLINPLNQQVTYRLKAKVAPQDASGYFHYSLGEMEVTIAPKGEYVIPIDLHLKEGLDRQHKDISVVHFLFGTRDANDWKKMLKSLHTG